MSTDTTETGIGPTSTSTRKSEEWPAIHHWLVTHNCDIQYERSYKGVFKRLGQNVPSTCVRYRIIENRYQNSGPRRCYIWWRQEPLAQMQETLAYLNMVYDDLEYVVLY
jgi:hypothetical protein